MRHIIGLIIFSFFFLNCFIIKTIQTKKILYVDNSIPDINPKSSTPDCLTYNPLTYSCDSTGTDISVHSTRDVTEYLKTCTFDEYVEVKFRRGQIWTFQENNDKIRVKKSHVWINVFGVGERPIIDGDNKYPNEMSPSNLPVGFAIEVFAPAGTFEPVTDFRVEHIEIRNVYPGKNNVKILTLPGGAMIIAGDRGDGLTYEGYGLIKNCYFHDLGWCAILIFHIDNSSLEIDSIEIGYTGNYPKNNPTYGWPLTIDGARCCNNVIRNSYIHHVYGEGIGAAGFSLVENNIIQDTRTPSIYYDARSSAPIAQHCIIRYNLVFGTTESEHRKGSWHAGIRIDDETEDGINTGRTIDIYGNIVINTLDGIGLRNHPVDGTAFSNFGKIRVFNNLMINNLRNIHGGYPHRHNDVEVKNNLMVIYDCRECVGCTFWDGSPDNWVFGVNHYWPEPSNSMCKNPNDEYSDPNLPRKIGWNSLTGLEDISFDDFIPPSDSSAVNNAKVEITPFNVLLTRGSDYSQKPHKLVFAEQNAVWDFGAILRDGKIVRETGGSNSTDDYNYVPVIVGTVVGSITLILVLIIIIIVVIIICFSIKKKNSMEKIVRSEIETDMKSGIEFEEKSSSEL